MMETLTPVMAAIAREIGRREALDALPIVRGYDGLPRRGNKYGPLVLPKPKQIEGR